MRRTTIRRTWAIAGAALAVAVLASGCLPPAAKAPSGPVAAAAPGSPPPPGASTRDPASWPFSSTSPWNTPLGSGAAYDPRQIVNLASTTPWINGAEYSCSTVASACLDAGLAPVILDNLVTGRREFTVGRTRPRLLGERPVGRLG